MCIDLSLQNSVSQVQFQMWFSEFSSFLLKLVWPHADRVKQNDDFLDINVNF